ncbi:PREDICTED: transcription elongation factor B polypeptide 3-like [Priapulus caudatus]|uniref:Transcription elongation factor B polypeptide 3-like n=1 Tax=Priapulus caudatus TaxID=37621 RepID=A0ABM1F2F0_PRICU|nr:PREDICTED: transcription elongation factor B polypeptide 3-like [Priapulus caudatus]
MADGGLHTAVVHYKKKLEKGCDKAKVLEILKKFQRWPITVAILQATGIGKTVNAFRKSDGDIGDRARILVKAWKELVENDEPENSAPAEESSSPERSPVYQEAPPDDDVWAPEPSVLSPQPDRHESAAHAERHSSSGKRRHRHERRRHGDAESQNSEPNQSRASTSLDNDRVKSASLHGDRGERRKQGRGGGGGDKQHHKADTSGRRGRTEEARERHGRETPAETPAEQPRAAGTREIELSSENNMFSFEDALNCDSKRKVKKLIKTKKPKAPADVKSVSTKVVKRSENAGASASSAASREQRRRDEREEFSLSPTSSPEKKVKTPGVNVDATLPSIQPNYKPMHFPVISEGSKKKAAHPALTVDEFIVPQKSRTAMYSGKKVTTHLTEVSSLYQSCIRVLIDNIDLIDYVGGIPFDILRPVLERCTSTQLYTIEDLNPHLVEEGETDVLWKSHCTKEFRNKLPDDMESWREVYLRLHDEREAKLKNITVKIQAKSIAEAAPVRTTKMAYVNSAAKPPRDVRRKQALHGTAGATYKSESEKKTVAQKVHPVKRMREVDQDTGLAAAGPLIGRAGGPKKLEKKVAPMMRKTLKMMKNSFRR